MSVAPGSDAGPSRFSTVEPDAASKLEGASESGAARPAFRAATPFLRYVGLRLSQMIPMLLMAIVVDFVLLDLAPGDMAQVIAGESGVATAEQVEHLRALYGLDQPAPLRLARYVGRVLSLDLGYSAHYHAPVAELIGARLPATALLAGSALATALLFGVAAGFAAAYRPGGWIDRTVGAFSAAACATPSFLVGLALVILFSVELQWLPAGGMADVAPPASILDAALDLLAHLTLPATTLGVFFAAIYARVTRTAMLEARANDYVRTAEAKGLAPLRIAYRHVLRNALLPIVTVVGLQAGSLLGGAVLVETVFSWPGLGRLAFDSISQRDFNLLSGVVLTGAIGVLTINFVVDLVYAVLDPRVRLR
jgi:peptide/nickel transport system permease protein